MEIESNLSEESGDVVFKSRRIVFRWNCLFFYWNFNLLMKNYTWKTLSSGND